MTRFWIASTVGALIAFGTVVPSAQRRVPVASMYAIVEKVVLEPSDERPERMQVWGTFAFVVEHLDTPNAPLEVSKAAHGYMYFRLPPAPSAAVLERATSEWHSVKAAAGAQRVIGFGGWCGGDLSDVDPRASKYIRVRPIAEAVVNPEEYITVSSAARPVAEGQYGEVVRRLREAARN
jgi:hypothetical protein